MKRKVFKRLFVAGLLTGSVVAVPGLAVPANSAHAAKPNINKLLKTLKTGALATFRVNGETLRVWTVNTKTIKDLKALKAGTSNAHIPNGRIFRGAGKGGYNKPWSWHLDPRDIQMAEVTTEACDGRPSYVEAHVAEFVDNVKRYCPWSAQLISLKLMTPAAPTQLRIIQVQTDGTSAQHTTVRLQWRDRATNETGFRIRGAYTRLYAGVGTQIWNVASNVTSTTVTYVAGGFNPMKDVCFTVAALNEAGESARSNKVCINS